MKNHLYIILYIIVLAFSSVLNCQVIIAPQKIQVEPEEQVAFSVAFKENGVIQQVLPFDFSFSSSAGECEGNVFFAPSEPGTYLVYAKYKNHTGIAMVTVVANEEISRIEIQPKTVTLNSNQSFQFSAKTYGKSGKEIPFIVAWGARGGKINSQGIFVAGQKEGEYIVVAVGSDISQSATIHINNSNQSTIETKPVAETKPVEEPKPIAETKPVAEPKPIAETKPVEEPKPIAESNSLNTIQDTLDDITLENPYKLIIEPKEVTVQPHEKIFYEVSLLHHGKQEWSMPWSYKITAKDGEVCDNKSYIAPERPGTYEVKFIHSHVTETAIVHVEDLKIAEIQVTPEKINLNAGESVTLKYIAYDNKKNELKGDWQILAQGGTINNQNQYIAGDDSGSYSITILEKKSGLSKNIDVNIIAKISEIQVTPEKINLNAGESVTLKYIAYDNKKNELKGEWQVLAQGGIVNNQNQYIAGNDAGSYNITILEKKSGLSKNVSVNIVAKISEIQVSPEKINVNAGETVTLKYNAYDNKKNEVKGEWQVLAQGGTINNQNQYIAGDDAGTYTITILEKKSGLSKNVSVEINKPVVYQIAVTPNPVVLAVGSKQKLNIKLLKNNRERLTWEWEFKITPSAGKMDRNIYIAPDKPGKYSITIIYNQTQFQKIECIVPVEVIPIQNEVIKEEAKDKEELKDKKEEAKDKKEEAKTETKNQKIKDNKTIEDSPEELFENMIDEFPIEDKETEEQNITKKITENKKQDITEKITENQALSNTQAQKNKEETIQQNTEKQNIEEKTNSKEEIQSLKEDKQLEKKQDFIDIDTKIAYIKIYPEQLQLGCGETSQLVAYAYNAQNRKVTGDIQWSATGGRITYAGVYIAGRNPGLFQIQARAKQNPNIMASILVNVQAKQTKSQENTQNKSTFMNEGYAWGVALKNGTSTQEQLIKYIAEDLIYKSSLSIYQFRQGFIKGYDALGNSRYQAIWSQSLLTLGYSYGKYLRIGTVSENQIVNFIRFTLKRFSMHDQDTFKKGFMQGYAYSGSEYIYQQLLKKAN